MSLNQVRIQAEDFDLSAEVAALRAANPKIGAIVTFVGVVRDLNEGATVAEMELEHYPGMTEQSIGAIIEQARQRWPTFGALVIHRGRAAQAAGPDRAGGGDGRASRRGVRGLRIYYRLFEDRGAVLEEGTDARGRAVGRCPCQRRCGVG